MLIKVLSFSEEIKGSKIAKDCMVHINSSISYPVLIEFDPDMKVGVAELEAKEDGVYAEMKITKPLSTPLAQREPKLKGHIIERVENIVTAIRPIAVGLVKRDS